MSIDRPHRRSALFALAMVLVVAGCGGDGPSGPGPDPDPDPQGDPAVVATLLVAADALPLIDSAPGWTDDGQWVLFTAGPGSIVWKVRADDPSVRIAVTDRDQDIWLLGGHSPCGLSSGRVGWFQGFVPNNFGMHIMGASAATAGGDPEPEILRTFAGPSVGLAPNQISSPSLLSFDREARRGVGTWSGTWFMHWEDREADSVLLTRPANGLEDCTDFRISPDGELVTYADPEGTIYWMPFNSVETTALGPGAHPSFSADNTLVGCTSGNGIDYVVRERLGPSSIVFGGAADTLLVKPVLSPDGERIAFLVDGDDGLSLHLGELRD